MSSCAPPLQSAGSVMVTRSLDAPLPANGLGFVFTSTATVLVTDSNSVQCLRIPLSSSKLVPPQRFSGAGGSSLENLHTIAEGFTHDDAPIYVVFRSRVQRTKSRQDRRAQGNKAGRGDSTALPSGTKIRQITQRHRKLWRTRKGRLRRTASVSNLYLYARIRVRCIRCVPASKQAVIVNSSTQEHSISLLASIPYERAQPTCEHTPEGDRQLQLRSIL